MDTGKSGFEWDERKRQDTLVKRGLDFADVGDFEMATAEHHRDLRRDYGATRYVSTGFARAALRSLLDTAQQPAARDFAKESQ